MVAGPKIKKKLLAARLADVATGSSDLRFVVKESGK